MYKLLICFIVLMCILLFLQIFKSESYDKYSVVIVSLSTSPQRLKHVKDRIREIFENQTVPPDFVYLNLPYRFKRNNEPYDEAEIQDLQQTFGDRLVVLRTAQDFGPATKLVPSISYEKAKNRLDSLVITIDDDQIYNPKLIEKLLHGYRKQYMVVAGTAPKMKHGLQLVEGFCGVLYPVCIFGSDFDKFIQDVLKCKQCFNMDDYFLSLYLQNHNIPVKSLNGTDTLRKDLSYGLEADALHKIDQSCDPGKRYRKCKMLLEDGEGTCELDTA